MAPSPPLPSAGPAAPVSGPPLLLEALSLGAELMTAGRVGMRQLPRLGRLAGGSLGAAAKGAVLAALVETPVALVEEAAAVGRGEKPLATAALAASGKVAAAALAGGAGAGVGWGLAGLGMGSLLAPVGLLLLVAGGAAAAVTGGLRIQAALRSTGEEPALSGALPPDAWETLRPGQVLRHRERWFAAPASR